MADTTGYCERCEQRFAKTRPAKRFCSEKCRKAEEQKRRQARKPRKPRKKHVVARDVPLVCAVCNENYMSTTQRSKYCSRRCKDKGKPSAKGLSCCQCGRGMVKGPTSSPQGEAMCMDCRRLTSKDRRRARQQRYKSEYRARQAMAISEPFTVYDIVDRDGTDCYLCDEPVDLSLIWPDQMCRSIDHVVPLVKGGHDVFENSKLTHLRCNATKSDHTDLEEVRSWIKKNAAMQTS